MRREHLSMAGSVASIVALLPLLASDKILWVIIPLAVLVVTFLVQLQASRHRRPRELQRNELIDEGNKLIRRASQLVVMFGRDLSWARDYKEAIQGSSGTRRVFVICQDSNLLDFRENARLLEGCGAHVVRTKDDHGIRATLIDSDQMGGGFILVADKQAAHEGEHRYLCKTYDHNEDKTLLIAMHKLFQCLTGFKQ